MNLLKTDIFASMQTNALTTLISVSTETVSILKALSLVNVTKVIASHWILCSVTMKTNVKSVPISVTPTPSALTWTVLTLASVLSVSMATEKSVMILMNALMINMAVHMTLNVLTHMVHIDVNVILDIMVMVSIVQIFSIVKTMKIFVAHMVHAKTLLVIINASAKKDTLPQLT